MLATEPHHTAQHRTAYTHKCVHFPGNSDDTNGGYRRTAPSQKPKRRRHLYSRIHGLARYGPHPAAPRLPSARLQRLRSLHVEHACMTHMQMEPSATWGTSARTWPRHPQQSTASTASTARRSSSASPTVHLATHTHRPHQRHVIAVPAPRVLIQIHRPLSHSHPIPCPPPLPQPPIANEWSPSFQSASAPGTCPGTQHGSSSIGGIPWSVAALGARPPVVEGQGARSREG